MKRLSVLSVLVVAVSACGGGGGTAPSPAAQPPAQLPSPSAPVASLPPSPPPMAQGPNRPPEVAGSVAVAVSAVALHLFQYDITQGFSDPDGDQLSFSVAESGSTPWLSFDGTRVSGVPPAQNFFQIFVSVLDGRGGRAERILNVTVAPNSPPVVTRPIGPMLVAAGAHVDFDATQAGQTFHEPDGDSVEYRVELLSQPLGLEVRGTQVVGSLSTVGAANFKVVARDPYGASSETPFSFAVAAPEPGTPRLPATPHVYDDAKLAWPRDFAKSRAEITPFWDTTPSDNPTSDAGAALGRVLFYDPRLSITNTHSCSSCHRQAQGFATPDRFPTGVVNMPLPRNAMGLTNVRYNATNRFFSDARVETLERLALLPIQEPTELGNSLPLLQAKLEATLFYPPLFESAFGTREITPERIGKALAQFMRAMVSYQSKFDAAHFEYAPGYYTNPVTVFTAEELRGEEVFRFGPMDCNGCHSDVTQMLSRPLNNGLDLEFADLGAGDGKFRTASLRNVALTAPYMHDGRFATLREVIDHYDSGQQFKHPNGEIERINHNTTEEDKLALEAFLRTLTDDVLINDPRFSDPFQ